MPVPSDEDLARIAADHDPTVGASGPDRLLGVWADTADRRSLLAAVAHAAALPPDDAPDAPLEREIRRRSGPERAALRAVLRAPLAPYRVEGGRMVPLVPIPAPTGPVRLRPVARPAGTAEVVFARVVEGPDGWEAVAPIGAPPLPTTFGAWLAELPDLAHHGHVLLRRVLESAW